MALFQTLEHFVSDLKPDNICSDRKKVLQPLISYIQSKVKNKEPTRLNFVCTHNSRRSHLAQIWAQTMNYHFKIPNTTCYSAGTETTALNEAIVETLKSVGFQITMLSKSENCIYSIKYSENESPIIGFSKELDHPFNPNANFAAIMTCSHASETCPIIERADQRIPITYEDPKVFDKTPLKTIKYLERSKQIATEMNYIFSSIKL